MAITTEIIGRFGGGVSLCVCQELSCVLVDWLWG